MAIAEKIQRFMQQSSWIRRMFEEGTVLKKKFGSDNVFDFSLGNPNVEPPEKFFEVLAHVAKDKTKGLHSYMSNAGYMETREAVAEYVSEQLGTDIFGEHVIMTCGAGGGLNVIFKTLLDLPCCIEF